MSITLFGDKVFAHNMKGGERVVNGIILANDNGKMHGIRPRWAQIYAVGPEVKHLEVGDWVLIRHGRWTHILNIPDEGGVEKQLRAIEYPDGILMISKTEPVDDIVSDSTEFGKAYRF